MGGIDNDVDVSDAGERSSVGGLIGDGNQILRPVYKRARPVQIGQQLGKAGDAGPMIMTVGRPGAAERHAVASPRRSNQGDTDATFQMEMNFGLRQPHYPGVVEGLRHRPHGSATGRTVRGQPSVTETPFQKATWSLMFSAASFGSG
jgi:hypothetical protein